MSSNPHEGPTKKMPLSFSISRILGTDLTTDDKKSNTAVAVPRDVELPRVPMTTIHHFGSEAETNYYTNFEYQVQPRACSTPENDEYPSPTPHYHHHVQYSSPQLKNSYSETNNRRTPEHTDIPLKPSFNNLENSYDRNLDSMGESYHHSPSPLKSKKKKTRTVFSRSQLYQLETAFDVKRYLSSVERSRLATQLNLSETQIKIWFQNRRNKWKREINGEMDEIPLPPAFAAGVVSPPFFQPSLNNFGHVRDARDELLRSTLSLPPYYSHPYAHESRLRPSYLPPCYTHA